MKKQKCPNCRSKVMMEPLDEGTLPTRKVFRFQCVDYDNCGTFGKIVLKKEFYNE